MSKPIFQEFKNALHMSKFNPHTSHNLLSQVQHQKSSRTPEKQPQFGLSTFSRNFKEIQQKESKFKQCMQGVGITIDDSGNLLMGQWKNNQIDGKYFLFKPNNFEQNNQNNGLCQYGYMKNGQLDGDNYIYNSLGTLSKAEFTSNKQHGKGYIIHNNKLFTTNQISEMSTIECQVINLPSKEGQVKKNNFLQIPHINSISTSNKITTNYERVSPNLFIKPNHFIEDIIRGNQQRGNGEEILACMSINEREWFVGFLEVDNKKKKVKCVNRIKRDSINGFGAIFKNQWPVSYGKYKCGQLQGLGRAYQTEMNAFDGYFAKGQLMEGFIVDYHAKIASFGHHSSIDPQYQGKQQELFVITNTFQITSLDCIIEYRRNFHLKSLNFNNAYFNPPKMVYRSPWPYNIMDKLNKKTHIGSIIKSFRPTLHDIDLSFIEKVNQNSDNRVERQLVDQIKQSFSFKKADKTNSQIKPQNKTENQSKLQIKSQNKSKIEEPQEVMTKKYQGNNPTKSKKQFPLIEVYPYQKIISRQKQTIINPNFKEARKSYVRQFKKQRNHTYSKQILEKKEQKQDMIGKIVSRQKNQMKTKYQQSQINNVQSSIKHVQSSMKHVQSLMKQLQSSKRHTESSIKQLQSSKKQSSTSIKHKTSSNHPSSTSKHDDRVIDTQNNLTELVNYYHHCQTERKKSISGNTTRRTNDQKVSPREITVRKQSERQGQKGRYSNNRRKVDLGLVYGYKE